MHPLLSTAVRCARAAGTVILNHLEQLDRIEINTKGRFDYVSEVDELAERRIIEHLTRTYPEHGIIAEESGSRGENNEFVWLIDPLDGTTNFLHGYPQFAVSIAVRRRGTLEHGVIFNPLANELFTASRGQGAQLNNRRIRCSRVRQLEHALLGTGFQVKNMELIDPWLRTFRAALPRCSGIRRSGSAAIDLSNLAAGRLDGFWELGLAPWDLAAGVLMVREAGGLIADIEGGQAYMERGDVIAAGPALFNQFLTLIRSRSG